MLLLSLLLLLLLLLLFDLLVTLTIFATYWYLEKIYPRKLS